MADNKAAYSVAAKFYARLMIHGNMADAIRYYRSKLRELKFNHIWLQHKVNLNEIVERFTPGAKGRAKGVKYEFENEHYVIKVDMPSGYLRIFDKKAGLYTTMDGTPSRDLEMTHFKLMRRKEMSK